MPVNQHQKSQIKRQRSMCWDRRGLRRPDRWEPGPPAVSVSGQRKSAFPPRTVLAATVAAGVSLNGCRPNAAVAIYHLVFGDALHIFTGSAEGLSLFPGDIQVVGVRPTLAISGGLARLQHGTCRLRDSPRLAREVLHVGQQAATSPRWGMPCCRCVAVRITVVMQSIGLCSNAGAEPGEGPLDLLH